jgi:hypothetical protein
VQLAKREVPCYFDDEPVNHVVSLQFCVGTSEREREMQTDMPALVSMLSSVVGRDVECFKSFFIYQKEEMMSLNHSRLSHHV